MDADNDILTMSTREMRTELRDRKRFRVPPSLAGEKKVFLICHSCGYAPASGIPSSRCPKCGSSAWERFALASRLVPPHMR